jgi:glycosyltransferase involved in cell wall biosynthesis
MGLSGVQRTLKFVKYLSDYGWRPTVLTVAANAYFALDESFLGELEGRPVDIWRTSPGRVVTMVRQPRTALLGRERPRKLLNRISQFFFIPDNKIGWRKQVRALLAERDLSHFDAVYSTAPPYTDHLIGLEIKRRHGLPLVVDYRDAWIEYPYHTYWTPWHRRRHLQLEGEVIDGADAIITASSYVRDLIVARHPDAASRAHVITQGYDPEDFEGDLPPVAVDPGEVNFVYTGLFYEDRDPLLLYRALVSIRASHPKLYERMRFYMIGYVQDEYRSVAETMGVADRFVFQGQVDHREAIAWLMACDIAWFNIGAIHAGYQTVSPGKVFEYLGSCKPIIAIIPENDIRTILSGFDHTFIIRPDDQRSLEEVLVDLAGRKLAGTLPQADRQSVERFSRRTLTGTLAGLLGEVAGSVPPPL